LISHFIKCDGPTCGRGDASEVNPSQRGVAVEALHDGYRSNTVINFIYVTS